MEREIVYRKIRSLKELREFITDALIDHAERRATALIQRNINLFYYEQGFIDALKTVRDLIGKEGLMMYRYVFDSGEEERKNEDSSYQ